MVTNINQLILIATVLFASVLRSNSQNDFKGKITYSYNSNKEHLYEINGLTFIKDSFIVYAVKKDSLIARKVDVFGNISRYYIKIKNKAYIFNPSSSVRMNYNRMPNVFNYKFVKKHKKKEQILGYTCTKIKYLLGSETIVNFWVADDINLTNHGSFFNFISNQRKIVLKRELIYNIDTISYEAIKIEHIVSEKDFDLSQIHE